MTSPSNIPEAHVTSIWRDLNTMSNYVFVLDTKKKPLDPIHPAKARKLLTEQKAAVFRRYPFTIILKEEYHTPTTKNYGVKIDPGSKVTGLAIIQGDNVIWAAELTHRGFQIKEKLQSRAMIRRNRRNRKTRYRKARYLNRTKPKGWLAPSLKHRVLTILTWVKRLIKYCPIASISQELVRFDTQALQNPEVSGVAYQQGELYGYEVREYLLEKWGRKCAYCGKENVPFEVEHIKPKSKGGSDRVSNLTISCHQCNQKKGNQAVEDFLKGKPDVLARVKAHAKAPLKDATAVNATRWDLYHTLKGLGLEVKVGTGGRTKYNRTRLGFPKTHWIDAACVGVIEELKLSTLAPLMIKCRGQGGRQKAAVNKYGYSTRHNPLRPIMGWFTGDVIAFKGKVGRLTTRSNGQFCMTLPSKEIINIKPKEVNELKAVLRKDGYEYS